MCWGGVLIVVVMMKMIGSLYDCAFVFLPLSSEERSTSCMFKHFPYAIVHFGGAFEVPYRADFAGNGLSLRAC